MSKTIDEAIKNLKAGSVITCIRPSYSNSLHRYTLIRDNGRQSMSFKLLSDGFTVMSGFESLNPRDAIDYLEGGGLKMTILEIKSPSMTDFYHAVKMKEEAI